MLAQIDPLWIPIIAVASVFLYLIVESICRSWTEAARQRSERELKVTLAQRGMSASEIISVVNATSGKPAKRKRAACDAKTTDEAAPPTKRPSDRAIDGMHSHPSAPQGPTPVGTGGSPWTS